MTGRRLLAALLLLRFLALGAPAWAGSASQWEDRLHPDTIRAMDYPNSTEPSSEYLAAAAILLVLVVWRRLRWDRRIATGVAGALVALCLAEGLLQLDRMYAPPGTAQFQPHPTLFWQMVPGGSRYGYPVNSDGLQNPEIPRQKPPGEFRILCLGDSSTIYRKEVDFSYPRQMEGMLDGVRVVNGGVSGYTSYQGLLLLRGKLVHYEPDVVVLGFGFHDCTPDLSSDRAHFTDRPEVHWARTLLYRSQLFLVLRRLTLGLSPDLPAPRQLTPRVSPEEYWQNLESFQELARQEGFRLAVVRMPLNMAVASPLKVESVRSYGRLAEEFGARQGIPVLDAMEGFPTEDFQPGNNNHLEASGAERLARKVADFLKEHGLGGDGSGSDSRGGVRRAVD